MKLLPGSVPGGAIVKAKTTKISVDNITPSKKVIQAKVKLIEINKILKGSLAAEKKEEGEKDKKARADQRNKREKKLEKRTKEEKKAAPKLPLPKVSFFDRIKNFIVNTALGFLLTRLVDETGAVKPIVPLIANTLDFAVDFTIGTLDAVGGFLEEGYKFIDSTKEWVDEKYGEEGIKKFNNFLDAVRNLFNAALIVAALNQVRKGYQKPDKKSRKPKGPGKPGGGTSRPPTAAERVRNSRIRNVQRRFGPAARQIYENALNNGKTPSQAQAAVNRALRRGQITARPGASSLASRTAPRGSILKGGLKKAPGRLGTKLLGKAGVKMAKGIFGKIPILGPIIVAVASLLGGEPPAQALFKGLGAALGGLLGTFIPIPVIGTLLGETIGVFVGDLLYELIRPGGGPEKAGAKFMEAMNGILQTGKAVGDWLGSGFKRYIKGFLKEHPVEIPSLNFFGLGARFLATKVAEMLGIKDLLKQVGYVGANDEVIKFPNILQMYNPFKTLPLLIKSFFPPAKNPPPESDEGFNFSKFFFGADATTGESGAQGAQRAPSSSGAAARATSSMTGSQGQRDFANSIYKAAVAAGAKHPEVAAAIASLETGWGKYEKGNNPFNMRGLDGNFLDFATREDSVREFVRLWDKNHSGYRNLESFEDPNEAFAAIVNAYAPASDGNNPEKYKQFVANFLKGKMYLKNAPVMDKGGMIGKGLFANLGKPEFVLDSDSTKAMEDNFPGFLHALNKADYSGALNVLRAYAPYEKSGVQFIPVPMPGPAAQGSKSDLPGNMLASFGGESDDWSQILYANG